MGWKSGNAACERSEPRRKGKPETPRNAAWISKGFRGEGREAAGLKSLLCARHCQVAHQLIS